MTRPLLLLVAAAHLLSLSACATARPAPAAQARALRPFRSQAELAAFHRRMDELATRENERRMEEARRAERRRGSPEPLSHWDYNPPPPWPDSVPRPPRQMERSPRLSPYGPLADEIEAGGDERPTVQVEGDRLLVLRRGRLFTVDIGGGALRPVSWVDAFGYIPTGGWHDEVLASGDRAVVIGSNYGGRDTELNLFRRDSAGELAHRDSYYLISDDDPWASHTYAARMAGGRLLLYTALPVQYRFADSHRPAIAAWGAPRQPTAPATRVYRAISGDQPFSDWEVLHTVMACDLGEGLRCESIALYAPRARVFHVSPTAVYLWIPRDGSRPTMLYRLPLDGSAPTALQVSGRPVDPSAFLESADGHLNVLLRPEPGGAPGQPPGYAAGPLALLRVPLAELGDGSRAAAPARYRALPLKTPGVLRHRFVGEWLIYGTGAGREAYAVRWAGGEVSEVPLVHPVDRIEEMGSGAVVMGTDGRELHLSTLRLGPGAAALAYRATLPGDTIHGFFYHAEGKDLGVVAVPVRGPVQFGVPGQLLGADQIRFLRNRDLRLSALGELSAGVFGGDDECVTSCLDWYRGTRPLFVGGRILALLGYELVEAVEEEGGLRELRRVSFAPHPASPNPVGGWTLTETLGERGGRYFCDNRGELRMDQGGTGFSARLQRTAECVVDGARTTTPSEGGGKVELQGNAVSLEVGACVYQGRLTSPGYLQGKVACRVTLPDGTFLPATGRWEARRQGG